MADHPLDPRVFEARWSSLPAAPEWLDRLCALDGDPPFPPVDPAHVRAMLRHGGFKPAGRNKPCSEYIRRVAEEGRFPRIDPRVDLTNAAALHSGLPVSTVDADRLMPPLSLRLGEAGEAYVFNASGQTLALSGLPCLVDADGPCANAVKDAQRTKTSPSTTRTLTVIWGTTAIPGRAEAVLRWMIDRTGALGAVAEESRELVW